MQLDESISKIETLGGLTDLRTYGLTDLFFVM